MELTEFASWTEEYRTSNGFKKTGTRRSEVNEDTLNDRRIAEMVRERHLYDIKNILSRDLFYEQSILSVKTIIKVPLKAPKIYLQVQNNEVIDYRDLEGRFIHDPSEYELNERRNEFEIIQCLN